VLLEKRLHSSIAHKAASFEWLLAQSQWDLALMVFGETHPAGHYLWPHGVSCITDPGDTRFDAIRRVYVSLDEALGSIRAALPGNATLMVVSGDGVTANNCGCHLVPDVLQKLGFARRRPPKKEHRRPGADFAGTDQDMVPKGAQLDHDHLPWWLRDGSARVSARKISTGEPAPLRSDRSRGCIRINLKGREPGDRGRGNYDALCEDIANRFRERSIRPPARRCARCGFATRYFRPLQDQLPDIMVTWNNSAPISAMSSARMGLVEQESPDPRTGTHSPRGFCLARGDRFARGASGSGRLEDVAPTVLGLVGAQAGAMDGTLLYDR
jgi:predicted AlkP superfamily phosphohydrolase/phosphomutase